MSRRSREDHEEPTVPCPHCGREIHEEAERCPHCENYISEEEDTGSARRPWWIVVGVLLGLYAVWRWVVG